ncbi:MAG: mechanosensitive ion channel [Flavobacteriaceae bacterium]|nr:MAG: mechanosensitive ion channel [Flavobacteriaceae bacterium]
MEEFYMTYQNEIINSAILFAVLGVISLVIKKTINRIAKRTDINQARAQLIGRYVTVTLLLVAILIESFILGVEANDIAVVFSSVFAVIGIALFAIWSILSNVTSGIIMFFSFPYKVGDKIEIHDKDYPIQGIIEDIRAFQLHLRMDNGDLTTYPNNLMLQKAVTLVKKDAIDDGTDSI